MSHLNGTQLIEELGEGAIDVYGEGYDVITSAQVNEFADDKALRVYYEGDHDDFVDTDDDMTYTDGEFTMSAGDTTNGSGWESEIAEQYGPGQDPGFYVEISEKKVAVTFDAEKNAWKVDSSALQVAENVDTIDMDAIMNSNQFAEDVMARFGLKPAAPKEEEEDQGGGQEEDQQGGGQEQGQQPVIPNPVAEEEGQGFPVVNLTNSAENIDLTIGHNGQAWILDGSISSDASLNSQKYEYEQDDYGSIEALMGAITTAIGGPALATLKATSDDDADSPTFDGTALHDISNEQWYAYLDNNEPQELVRRKEPEEEEPIRERIVLEEEREPVIKLPSQDEEEELVRREEPVIITKQMEEQEEPVSNHSFSNDIYLNASEETIAELLKPNGEVTQEAFNFSFYTKMDLVTDQGTVTVNIKLHQDELISNKFSIDPTDIDVPVESFYNVADDDGAAVTSSSAAGEFVKIDNADDIALGNGGDDTYVVEFDNDTSDIYGGIALEYGNINVRGGLSGSIDAVNFNSVDEVSDLTFRRGTYRNEEEGNTLFIGQSDGSGGVVGNETILFDNYNEYLDFRRVEYLTVEDGANNDEIYEIVTNSDDNIEDWDNEIYVANGGSMDVELGGTDYVIGSDGKDTFNFELDDITSSGSGTINLSNISSDDTLVATDASDFMSAEDKTAFEAALAAGVDAGVSQVRFSYDSDAADGMQLTLGVGDAADVYYNLDYYSGDEELKLKSLIEDEVAS
jgi:hypothetical protein